MLRALWAHLGAVVVTGAIACSASGCGGDEFTFTAGGGGTGGNGRGGSGGQGGAAHQGGGGAGGAAQGGGGGVQGGGGSASQGGGGSVPIECGDPGDCDGQFGPSPCGVWACNGGACEASSPGCADVDQDGYGTGANCQCAGIDCDDANQNVGDTASAACYTGLAGTDGVGTCHSGTTTCTAGAWTPCVGEVTPSGEACNGEDDDCDATVDDGLGTFTCGLGACKVTVNACVGGTASACVPAAPAAVIDGPACNGVDDDCDGPVDEDCKSCIPVSLAGNDMIADGTFVLPFQTIQAAINWAVAHPAGPQTVCVAAGAVCGTGGAPVTGTYSNANGTTITMADGVSVLGNYESTLWNRCAANTTTTLQPKTPEGVTFPATVTKLTVLDGFRIERFNSVTTAGVTVSGAKNVLLSNIAVQNTPSVTNSYGVNLINGAEATITKSRIDAGFGTTESIGVRSVGSKLSLQNNCLSPDPVTGRCDDFCGGNPSIRGRTTQGTGVTYAVLLDNSPGSKLESSAMCAADADIGAVIRIMGDGAGIQVRGSLVNSFGGLQHAHGIWMEDCNDAAPWIVDNHYIAAGGDNQMTTVNAIRAIGACHPVIDSNVQITGGGEGQASNPIGVYCGMNAAAVTSKCVILGNQLIEGSDFGFPPIATGVRCDDGGCGRIADNTITGRGGVVSVGVWLGKAGPSIEDNLIRGGCSGTATGVRTENAFARLENNRIFGYSANDCTGAGSGNPTQSFGLRVFAELGLNELDVHSNDIDGGGTNAACASIGLTFEKGMNAPVSGRGIFRNNIIRAGSCTMSKVNVRENDVAADPRVFENNDLDPFGAPMALYVDEAANSLTTPAAVDMLADMIVSATLSADAMFVAYPGDLHLLPGSPCIGAGTAVGAPLIDMDGDPRDLVTPSIGADE